VKVLTLFQAVILGLVQGLGEFLPISSSAHLVLVPWLFKWTDPGLTFDVALHAGTLFSVILYFWKDWIRLISKGLTDVHDPDGKLFWYLAVASIPGAFIGFVLEHKAETVFRSPLLVAVMLIGMGLVLWWSDRRGAKEIDMGGITLKASLLIGLSQALAIIPGVSRSGITMAAGLGLGLTRKSAARFSFLLSTPIIFGAALVQLPDILAHPEMLTVNFLSGMLVSFISGWLSIGILLKYVQTRDFMPFVWYRLFLGAAVIVVFFS
jgi:undecaprenyl-diphosphatase